MEGLQPLHRRVAGIDVHRMVHVVTVAIERPDGSVEQSSREFGGFRRDCRALAAWLADLRVEPSVWPRGLRCARATTSRRANASRARPAMATPSSGEAPALQFGAFAHGGCMDGGMPGVQGAIALGLSHMRNSVSRWRCLQLGCAKPKLRERRNPLDNRPS